MVIREEIRYFAEYTSVKGVSRIPRSRHRSLCIMWVIAVIVGTVVAMFQVTLLLRDYFAYPITTQVNDLDEAPPFPDVTVCNLNPISSSKAIKLSLEQYLNNVTRLMEGLNPDHPNYELLASLQSLQGYHQTVSDTLKSARSAGKLVSNFVTDCHWHQWSGTKTTESKDSTGTGNGCDRNTLFHFINPEYSVCFTFHTEDSEKGFDHYVRGLTSRLYLDDFENIVIPAINMELQPSMGRGVHVLVHPPNTLPDLHHGINIAAGQETSLRITTTANTRLQSPHGKCTKNDYMTSSSNTRYKYTKVLCRSLCYQDHVIKNCGCLDASYTTTDSQERKYSFCGSLSDGNVTATLNKLKCMKSLRFDTHASCNCPEPCKEYMYKMEIFAVPWPHESHHLAFYDKYIKNGDYPKEFDIYKDINKTIQQNKTLGFQQLRETQLITRNFVQLNAYISDPEVRYFKDASVYPWEQFFSQVGGTMNLWIGITFVTLVEVLDLFLCVCFSLSTKTKSKTLQHNGNSSKSTSDKSPAGSVVPISSPINQENRYEPSPRGASYNINDERHITNRKSEDHRNRYHHRKASEKAAIPYTDSIKNIPPTNTTQSGKSNGALNLALQGQRRREAVNQRAKHPRKNTTVVQNGVTLQI